MKVPEKYKDKITQEKLDEWYDDAINNYYESSDVENSDEWEEEAHKYAEFIILDMLKQEFDK